MQKETSIFSCLSLSLSALFSPFLTEATFVSDYDERTD